MALSEPKIWTVGHSDRSLEEFLDLVRAMEVIADVRRFPASRRVPHFNRESLERALPGYRWFEALGGRRHGKAERHAALRSAAFRAYAGYMETPEFLRALDELEALARARRVALMCAEAVWFRCHRMLLADALLARGWTVLHLPGERPHRLSRMARIEGRAVVYDVAAE